MTEGKWQRHTKIGLVILSTKKIKMVPILTFLLSPPLISSHSVFELSLSLSDQLTIKLRSINKHILLQQFFLLCYNLGLKPWETKNMKSELPLKG